MEISYLKANILCGQLRQDKFVYCMIKMSALEEVGLSKRSFSFLYMFFYIHLSKRINNIYDRNVIINHFSEMQSPGIMLKSFRDQVYGISLLIDVNSRNG